MTDLNFDKDKINIASCSGGRSSAYLVYRLEKLKIRYGLKTHYVFMDTGMEDPRTYDFIRNLAKFFNIKIACLRLKINPILGKGNDYTQVSLNDIKCDFKPWRDMIKKYGTPTVAMPFCTARMKTEIYTKYCNKWFGKNNYITWIGIRIDEQHRINTDSLFIKYLANISTYTKSDILRWWQDQEFDLNIPEYLGNCLFCVKKGANRLALAAKTQPKYCNEFIKMVNDPEVRILPNKKDPTNVMFRGRQSLEDILETYKDVSIEQLVKSLQLASPSKTEPCEESCEVFNTSDNFITI